MKTPKLVLLLLISLPLTQVSAQDAPSEIAATRSAHRLSLGRSLFRSPHLSGRKRMTCATCHEPGYSFTDGVKESPGVLGAGVGRNSPTMFAIGHVKHFPGPKVNGRSTFKPGSVLSLAERCLVPIENPLEMASSVKDAVSRLRETKGMKANFSLAFGPSSNAITPKKIGQALATYLESIKPPTAPYRDFLAGNKHALSHLETRGMDIFNSNGSCSSCHSGQALSDGQMHLAFMPGSSRAKSQASRNIALAQQVRERVEKLQLELPKSGIGRQLLARIAPPIAQGCDAQMSSRRNSNQSSYDGQDPQFQLTHNLSLWDVDRTAPYFRDGSSKTLEGAIQSHIKELRDVSKNWKRARQIRKRSIRSNGSSGTKKMTAAWLTKGKIPPTPEDLTEGDVRALIAFLETLSPRE